MTVTNLKYTVEMWRAEVAAGQTIKGYTDWVAEQIAFEDDDNG